jgi:two-component system cell cycle response regulator
VRVLIAEDDLISRRLLESFLQKWGYEVVLAAEGNAAWQTLQQADAPRLAILDWMMPGKDGVQICREIRQLQDQPYIYVLLLTAKGQKLDLLSGLEAGADDYLTKPFDPHELRARLRAGQRIIELQEQLINAQDVLRKQAVHDSLTGLWNRRGILDFLRREVARASRENSSVAVAIIDVDHFKSVNDTYGHLAGDAVLCEIARRLGSTMRAYNALGRYAGDEFLGVISGCNAAGALSFAENLRRRIDSEPIRTAEGVIPTTLSVGVALGCDSRELSIDDLLRAADMALYRSKSAGRNHAELATPADFQDPQASSSAGTLTPDQEPEKSAADAPPSQDH